MTQTRSYTYPTGFVWFVGADVVFLINLFFTSPVTTTRFPLLLDLAVPIDILQLKAFRDAYHNSWFIRLLGPYAWVGSHPVVPPMTT